jgi:hypothetical protein
MKLESRIQIEKRIARRVVRALLAAGYDITVNNGGDEDEIPYSASFKQITEAMFATDDERLYLRRDGRNQGWVWLVYGNDGYDVICDYTTNLSPVIEPIEAYIDAQEVK